MSEKFKFDVPFQWEILRFTLKDKQGYKALLLFKHNYFDLLDQQVIAKGIERFFKRKKRVPSSAAVMNEELNSLFRTRDYAQSLLEEDRKRIKVRVRKLYKRVLRDGDEILHQVKIFASYVEFKKTLEDINLEDFQQYEGYAKKIQKAINLGMEVNERRGRFIVAGHQARIVERYNTDDVIPTPFRQLNNLTNAGGYEKGSVLCFIDRPKKGKTQLLINFAAHYIKRKGEALKTTGKFKGLQRSAKKVVYFDFENGETAISTRIDMCLLRKTKKEILSHEYDDKLKKIYRQFRRYQGEIYVIRMSKNSTTTDLQRELDDVYTQYGIKFEVAIIDYAALMGSTSGAKEEHLRISDVFVDLKDWTKVNDFDLTLTANHVKREAYKRRLSKYEPDDIAKCIDIERHVDGLFGLQQSKLDEEAKVLRVEVLDQRDGVPIGRVLLWEDNKTQSLREFTREEEFNYNSQLDMSEKGNRTESDSDKEARMAKQRKVRSDI